MWRVRVRVRVRAAPETLLAQGGGGGVRVGRHRRRLRLAHRERQLPMIPTPQGPSHYIQDSLPSSALEPRQSWQGQRRLKHLPIFTVAVKCGANQDCGYAQGYTVKVSEDPLVPPGLGFGLALTATPIPNPIHPPTRTHLPHVLRARVRHDEDARGAVAHLEDALAAQRVRLRVKDAQHHHVAQVPGLGFGFGLGLGRVGLGLGLGLGLG